MNHSLFARSRRCHNWKFKVHAYLPRGQVDLAETDENGNENEKGNGRQEGYKCGVGRRPCNIIMQDSVVHPETCHRLKAVCSF